MDLSQSLMPQFPRFGAEVADSPALEIVGRGSVTFGEVEGRSRFLAAAFAGAEGPLAKPAGTIVAYVATAELELPELLMAVGASGLRLLALPDILAPAEVEAILGQHRPELLFCTREYSEGTLSRLDVPAGTRLVLWGPGAGPAPPRTPPPAAEREPAHEASRSDNAPLQYEALLAPWRSETAEDLLARAEAACASRKPAPHDDFMLFLTSGTTGTPKVVRTTHVSMAPSYLHIAKTKAAASRTPKGLFYNSMAWVGGAQLLTAFLYNGQPAVWMPNGYAGLQPYLDALLAHRPTMTCWLPMAFEDMCKLPAETAAQVAASGLEEVVYAGASFPLPLVRRGVRMFPAVRFFQGYGSTEAGMGGGVSHDQLVAWLAYLDANPQVPQILPSAVVDGSLGPLMKPRVLVDASSAGGGPDAAPGEVGDVVLETAFGCSGYLNAPEKDAELFLDPEQGAMGGLVIGDRGKFLDVALEEGSPGDTTRFLVIEGRAKDVVVTRLGYNVTNVEVMHAVRAHPVLSGLPVAVGPVKDAEGSYDEVCCWVATGQQGDASCSVDATGLSLEALNGFLAGRLAAYKLPAHLRFVEELPINRNGKTDLNALKKQFRHRQQEAAACGGTKRGFQQAVAPTVPVAEE